MSAFTVSDKHIHALLSFAMRHQYNEPGRVDGMVVRDQPNLIGQLLVEANCRSVNYRYNETDQPHEYIFQRIIPTPSAIQIVKACHCFEYQACEYDEWKTSKAKRIIDDIRERAIREIPGYEEAAWDII